jgi:FKBP-type peptidyl-prolyl cis-trans isomerase FkpA
VRRDRIVEMTIKTRVTGILAAVSLAALVGCGGGDSTDTTAPTGPTQLQVQDITVGSGATAANGDTVNVNYVGAFLNGTIFDQGNLPAVTLGAHQVIAGFEQGIVGMKVGGVRLMVIPSELAYGATGRGSIPPNTPLQFQVQLVAIQGK